MINLHRNIKEQYGLEAIQQLRQWEKNTIRASNYKNHRIFTLKCIGLNLILVSIRLKPVASKQHISPIARKIIEKAEKQLLQDRVRGINKTIQDNEDQANLSKSKLVAIITQVDLDRCTDFIEKVRLERFKQVKNRQVRKLHILSSKHHSAQVNNNTDNNNRATLGVNANNIDSNEHRVRHGNDQQTRDYNQDNTNSNSKWVINLSKVESATLGVNANNIDSNEHRVRHGNDQQTRDYNQDNTNSNSKWVINLSKVELTWAQRSLLEKGPNFAISPSNIPNLDYITAIETVCSKLKEEDAAELRGEINGILKKGKIPKPNPDKDERTALHQLRRDKNRVILTVDKGVAMVVLDREDYINKAKELLNTPVYKEIPKDPTYKIKAQLITKLRRIKKG